MTEFDSFFSYAGEDKQFASEIVGALKAQGFNIWYAPLKLTVGEKLLSSIEEGIVRSRTGILLLSSHYLEKGWTNYEMDVLIRRSIEIDTKIFPIWHNVTKTDVENKSPGLSGIVSLNTNDGIQWLVSELVKVLSKSAPTIGVIPSYESPAWRFLQGRGEIKLGSDGPATTLWEFLLYSKDYEYPLFLDGRLYHKIDLLYKAAELLPHIPEVAENWVRKEGREKIWNMCVEAGLDPYFLG